jgi:hypothetical protein
MEAETRARRLLLALAVYVMVVGVNFSVVPQYRILEHTPFNHFALLADAWLDGRLDLGDEPPAYAQNNDFARHGDKWFITFPPFPAVLLLPVAWLAGSVEDVRDGQFFVWLSGVGPALLFLALERLRRAGMSQRRERTNLLLALTFAFGTVYFFTALQGTVWFAAHVVAVALAAGYMLAAIEAKHPLWAGTMIGLGFLTRTPLIFAVGLFAVEAVRVSLASSVEIRSVRDFWRALALPRVLRYYALFSVPILCTIGFALWHNSARFGSAFDFGYADLTVAWQARMKRWGLFNYHYLARNLGVALTGLPWIAKDGGAPFQINAHGLALWVTTPIYFFLLWPRVVRPIQWGLIGAAAGVALPGLLYQNTGWMQFGYRFSNDYAVFLFALLAHGQNRFRYVFWALAIWGIAVNAFGAVTFDRGEFRKFYYEDRSQRILYQPD